MTMTGTDAKNLAAQLIAQIEKIEAQTAERDARAAAKLADAQTFEIARVVIRKDRDTGEFVCRAYLADGTRYGRADAFEDTRQDAEDTKVAMLAPIAERLAEESATRDARSAFREWKDEPYQSLGGAYGRTEVTLNTSTGVVIVPALTFEEWRAQRYVG